MRRSIGQQGQFSLRKALTVATTPGHGNLKRCHDNMRSVLGAAGTLKPARIPPGRMWEETEERGKSFMGNKAALPGISAIIAFEGLVYLLAKNAQKPNRSRSLACANL